MRRNLSRFFSCTKVTPNQDVKTMTVYHTPLTPTDICPETGSSNCFSLSLTVLIMLMMKKKMLYLDGWYLSQTEKLPSSHQEWTNILLVIQPSRIESIVVHIRAGSGLFSLLLADMWTLHGLLVAQIWKNTSGLPKHHHFTWYLGWMNVCVYCGPDLSCDNFAIWDGWAQYNVDKGDSWALVEVSVLLSWVQQIWCWLTLWPVCFCVGGMVGMWSSRQCAV